MRSDCAHPSEGWDETASETERPSVV